MTFEQILRDLELTISRDISRIYHLSEAEALEALKDSKFHVLLSDEATGLWKDGAGVNFTRYQNEVEYGAWNK